jgi:hypothetical protein
MNVISKDIAKNDNNTQDKKEKQSKIYRLTPTKIGLDV